MKIVLVALCTAALPLLTSRPAPSLQNQFVAFFISQDLDKAKGVYKDMPDFQKIEALQAVFDISDPSTMDRKFQESLARFLTNPINIDHSKFWKQLSVPTRWQDWIGKQQHLKKVAKPLSSSKKPRPTAPADRPSSSTSSEPAPVPSAAYDVKGEAAAAAAGPAGAPAKPTRKKIPADVITKRLEAIGTMESKAEMIDVLRDFLRVAWIDFNDDHKVIAATFFASVSPVMQRAVIESWRKNGISEGVLTFFAGYMAPAPAKPAEGELKRAPALNPLEQMLSDTVQELATIKQSEAHKLVAQLFTFIKDNWDLLNSKDVKPAVAQDLKGKLRDLFATLSTELQASLIKGWENDKDVTRAAPRFFRQSAESAQEADMTTTIDNLLKEASSKNIPTIIDILRSVSPGSPNLMHGVLQIGLLKFTKLTDRQKKDVAELFLNLSDAVKEGLLEAWRAKAPQAKDYFEKAWQAAIKAGK